MRNDRKPDSLFWRDVASSLRQQLAWGLVTLLATLMTGALLFGAGAMLNEAFGPIFALFVPIMLILLGAWGLASYRYALADARHKQSTRACHAQLRAAGYERDAKGDWRQVNLYP